MVNNRQKIAKSKKIIASIFKANDCSFVSGGALIPIWKIKTTTVIPPTASPDGNTD